jgi:hypothetical protein
MEYRYQFLRDSKGQPVGCVVIRLGADCGSVNTYENCRYVSVKYQFSVLNPEDRFNRTLAREIALARLQKYQGYWTEAKFPMSHQKPTMHSVTKSVMTHLAKNGLAPARARKAAKLWLDQHNLHNVSFDIESVRLGHAPDVL